MSKTGRPKNEKMMWGNAGIILIIMVSIAVVAMLYTHNLNDKLYAAKSESMQMFVEDACELVEELKDTSWNHVDGFDKLLISSDISSEEELLDLLDLMNDIIQTNDELYFVFSSDTYFTSNGEKGPWYAEPADPDVEPMDIVLVSQLPCTQNDHNYIICIRQLSEPKAINENTVIFSTAVAFDTESLSTKLTDSALGQQNVTFILDGELNVIYSNSGPIMEQVRNGNSDKIKERLEALRFVRGSNADEFKNALFRTGKAAAEIHIDGQEYIAAVSHVESLGWTVLEFAAREAIGTDTTYFIRKSMGYYLTIGFLMVITFALIVFFVVMKKSDDKLLKIKEENNELLSKAVEDADRANHAKTEFLSHMSHDIRTPINGIMGMTSIALKNIGNWPKVQNCLMKIDDSSRHLLSLVNDILDMSRIESGKVQVTKTEFNLEELVNNCRSIISGQLEDRELEVIQELNINHKWVSGDELHLRQILINILGNSLKFTPDGGQISIKVDETDSDTDEKWSKYRFTLSDTGIGMSEEFLTKIFEPFAQDVESARTNYVGTGLGMAITKKFVDLMDGEIVVKSDKGHGSTFVVDLPFNVNEELEQKTSEEEDYSSMIKGAKVLLAEDNSLNAEIVCSILEDVGVSVDVARNGKIAVDKFVTGEQDKYDLILMDIMMDVMDGLEATRAIRKLERKDAKTIPIIALTANAYEEDIKKTRNAGMNAHLTKPIAPNSLYRAIYNNVFMEKNEGHRVMLRGLRVILAEDNDINAEIATELLQDEKMIVTRVVDGYEAWQLFENDPPYSYDVILMDMQMPKMNGLEATKKIRSGNKPDAKTIKIIAMTANVFDEDIKRTKEVGMNAHLTKPIEIEKLMETIKQV